VPFFILPFEKNYKCYSTVRSNSTEISYESDEHCENTSHEGSFGVWWSFGTCTVLWMKDLTVPNPGPRFSVVGKPGENLYGNVGKPLGFRAVCSSQRPAEPSRLTCISLITRMFLPHGIAHTYGVYRNPLGFFFSNSLRPCVSRARESQTRPFTFEPQHASSLEATARTEQIAYCHKTGHGYNQASLKNKPDVLSHRHYTCASSVSDSLSRFRHRSFLEGSARGAPVLPPCVRHMC